MTIAGEARALSALGAGRAQPLLTGTPWRGAALLASGFLVVAGLTRAGLLPAAATAVAAIAAVHGTLLATAVAWSDGRAFERERTGPTLVLAAVLVIAAAATAVHPLGAVMYVAPPLVTAVLLDPRRAVVPSRGILLVAAVFGCGLGAHILLAASATLDHRPHVPGLTAAVAALGYDVGANVLSAECFFRGALFDRLQRRWSFTAAAGGSTGAYLLRYGLDPLLPKTPEALIGAAFYLGLLGVFNCWLVWRSGSILPGIVSSLLFFTAYRLLTTG
ncbi:MAG TPA: CPBP family glutamic-type intramembrane protease [Methylomirabilota bacterium]